jgi:hypothetical protein
MQNRLRKHTHTHTHTFVHACTHCVWPSANSLLPRRFGASAAKQPSKENKALAPLFQASQQRTLGAFLHHQSNAAMPSCLRPIPSPEFQTFAHKFLAALTCESDVSSSISAVEFDVGMNVTRDWLFAGVLVLLRGKRARGGELDVC